jgi:hypothetical protein
MIITHAKIANITATDVRNITIPFLTGRHPAASKKTFNPKYSPNGRLTKGEYPNAFTSGIKAGDPKRMLPQTTSKKRTVVFMSTSFFNYIIIY